MNQKTIFSIIIFNLILFTAFGQQKLKVGYADVEYILSKMPETTKAQVVLDEIATRVSKTRDSMILDYSVKLEAYKKTVATLEEAIKKEKETDLLKLQQSIQGFDKNTQIGINSRKNELLTPIYNRIGELVSVVAKENGYTHILNAQINGNSVLIYAEESTDISDLVIAKAK